MTRPYRLSLGLCLALVLASGPSCSAGRTSAAHVPAPVLETGRIRAWHFIARAVPLERALWMVDCAQQAGFNTVTILLTDGVRLEKAPWTPRQDAWSTEELAYWVAYARERGMAVVPAIELLTHQQLLLQELHPELLFNKVTYDPRKDEVYQKVLPLLEEVITLFRPQAVHIGHDEVARPLGSWIRPGEQALPADLFLADVLRLHSFLKDRGIETWMWGDMLVGPGEFPGMDHEVLHGTLPGYGKELRDRIPRDIVICDWHYFDEQQDFPSLLVMQKEGFRVIGATWKKKTTISNFSRYARSQGAYGMMATTFHLQGREWDVVENILSESGEAFRVFR